MVFKDISKRDMFFYIMIFFATFFILYIVFIDKKPWNNFTYNMEKIIIKKNIRCSSETPKWVEESLNYIIDHHGSLVNQIAYLDQNKKIYTCESGRKGKAVFSEKLNENTRFRYASLTKLFTSDAVLAHINNGSLKLDSKLVEFIPELKQQKFKDRRIQDITVAQLLEHRSGFDRMRSEDVVFAINKKSWCPYDLEKLADIKLDFNPGERYAYDNRNYCLLGVVLERLENQNYRAYMQKRYALIKKNIKFVDGSYYPDEVKYDFRNNNFWIESDDNKFDFIALSSSAGLSGSAKQLAISIQSMLKESKNLNILSIRQDTLNNCHLDQFKSCNGYAMWQYQASENQPKMYFRNGGLLAVTSMAIVTENNEILVWIGNGASLYTDHYDENLLEKYFYKILSK